MYLLESYRDNRVNIGRWSEISVNKIPLFRLWDKLFVKMLSIGEAEWDVILVGLLMSGRKQCENIVSR